MDGTEWNRVEEQPLRLRPLYLAASTEDGTGDIILKAVNVQAEPVTAQLEISCSGYDTEVLCAPPDAVYSLDDPDNVAPVMHSYGGGNEITHTFPGYSVTVMQFHP